MELSPPPYDDKKSQVEGPSCIVEEGGVFRLACSVDKRVRQAFIRKVYSIIGLQLLMTVGIVAIFTFVQPVNVYMKTHAAVCYASYIVFLICYLVLAFCKNVQRRFPWNIILMTVFTLAMGFMTGTVASVCDTKAVLLAVVITATVTVTIIVFSFQTKVDVTSCLGFFCILAIVLSVTGIITVIVLVFNYIYWLHMFYAAISATAFTLFLAYDTQLLLGHKKDTISPEDYIYGAIQVYVDIICIFLTVTQLLSSN